jgi:hypothetical protein
MSSFHCTYRYDYVQVLFEKSFLKKKPTRQYSTWNGDVERLGSEEGLHIEQVEVVIVHQIGQQLIRHPVN